jgi:YegS/Rv2252/BmrU family lipid kinase
MDFARNLGIPRGVRAAVDRIVTGRERRVDVGFVPSEQRAFVNFMETGLGAAVVAREARLSDAWPGRASFLVAAVGAAMAEKNVPIRVASDGTSIYEGSAVSVVVANGQYFGGGMKIAPVARLDDGYLDLMILGDFRRLELVRQIWKIYPGVHLTNRKVLHVRARSISIQAPDSALLDLDGELGGNPSTTIQLLPSALRVLA